MELSIFDIFKIGIGPSSSHTVGPMRAANFLLVKLKKHELFEQTARIRCELYGSLASTGRGHHTDRAVIWGLQGEEPETIDPDRQDELYDTVVLSSELVLGGERAIGFIPDRDIVFRPDELLPFHPNGILFTAFDDRGAELFAKEFYSIGGGFIVGHKTAEADELIKDPVKVEHPFASGDELLEIARSTGKSVAEIVLANEHAWRTTGEIEAGIERICRAMNECIERGYRQVGKLPGSLGLQRRTPALHETLTRQDEGAYGDPLGAMDWILLYALAVNEENAAGGRVVTAPTKRGGRYRPRVPAVPRAIRQEASANGRARFSAHRRSHSHALQNQRLDLGRRSRLPGRGRGRLLDGRGRVGSGRRRHA
jgi:L-serine dehydratase